MTALQSSKAGGARPGVLPAALIVAALLGCSTPAPVGPGESCFRASDCVAGLVCVGGMCTDDLSGLEGGVVPFRDAGGEILDAGPLPDTGPLPDAGPLPDTGPPPPDTGTPLVDAGPPRVDAGPPRVDAGPPRVDAGPPPMDAGPPPDPDTGTPDVDAGDP